MDLRIITLLSDFGLKDPYVAEMKAVILTICPKVRVVDISHEIDKFNIRRGAFVLASAAPYFPKDTIHVAVVDPGVGTRRRPLIVETERCFYVGPDNGLLILSAQRERIRHVYTVSNPRYMLPRISRTFHGRDIFASAAAHLARECSPSEFGPEVQDYVVPKFVKPWSREGTLFGEILHIDDFGNIVSNFSLKDLEKTGIKEGGLLSFRIRGKAVTLKFCSAYGEVPAETPLAIIGSIDLLEISINQGNASEEFKAKIGDRIRISPSPSSISFGASL